MFSYDPFGMITVGRSWEVGSEYRYGFSGKEKDAEIHGDNNSLDFGSRIYNPRLGRWFSVDKFASHYLDISPYTFALNSPIVYLDPDGNAPVIGAIYYFSLSMSTGEVCLENKEFEKGTTQKDWVEKDLNSSKQNTYKLKPINDNNVHFTASITANNQTKTYNINSPYSLNGRDSKAANDGKMVSPTGITTLSEGDLAILVAYGLGIIDDKYNGSAIDAAYGEAKGHPGDAAADGGLLDFKFLFDDLLATPFNDLIEIDGVLYNANEAGNYVWSLVLEYSGIPTFTDIPYPQAEWADLGSRMGKGHPDEWWEQKAIRAGADKGKVLLSDAGFKAKVILLTSEY